MIKKIVLSAINFYQKFLSPNLQKSCRFWPSCSEYFYLAIEKYGVARGLVKGFSRLLKCYPWHQGGIDLP